MHLTLTFPPCLKRMRCDISVCHQRALPHVFKATPWKQNGLIHKNTLNNLNMCTCLLPIQKQYILVMKCPSFMTALFYRLFFLFLLLAFVPWPHSSDTHRTAFCTCWTATNALKQSLSAFKTARTGSTWSSPVKRESMTKWWRVRFLLLNVAVNDITETAKKKKNYFNDHD